MHRGAVAGHDAAADEAGGLGPDRRGSEAVLTDEGMAALREASPTHLRGIERHFSRHLNGAEAKAIATGLGKVVDASARAGQTNRSRSVR